MTNNVAYYRKRKNMTQGFLAEMVGTTKQNISFIESGKRSLDKWVVPIAEALGCKETDLFSEEDNQTGQSKRKIKLVGEIDKKSQINRFPVGNHQSINSGMAETTIHTYAIKMAKGLEHDKYGEGATFFFEDHIGPTHESPPIGRLCYIELTNGISMIAKLVGKSGEHEYKAIPVMNNSTVNIVPAKICPIKGIAFW